MRVVSTPEVYLLRKLASLKGPRANIEDRPFLIGNQRLKEKDPKP